MHASTPAMFGTAARAADLCGIRLHPAWGRDYLGMNNDVGVFYPGMECRHEPLQSSVVVIRTGGDGMAHTDRY